MILQSTITTPANTSAASPLKTVMKGMRGVVYRGEVVFPPGPSGLVGVRVFDAAFQLFPFTPGEWFTGDNGKIEWSDVYRKDSEPFVFPVHTYNLDDTYDHIAIVRLWIATTEEEISAFVPLESAKRIEAAVDRVIGTVESQKNAALSRALAVLRRKKG